MSKLVWDATGAKTYETGVSKVVLFPFDSSKQAYGDGVAWSGVTAINESPSGAEATKLYADNQIYLTLTSLEEYGATIEAYMSPEEFDECDGSAELTTGVHIRQQTRKTFGLSFETIKGSDTEGDAHGRIIHLIYGATASPSSRDHATVNDSPEASSLSWEITTTPINVDGYKATATLEIDTTQLTTAQITAIEKKLYGDDSSMATLPLPLEVKTIIDGAKVSG